MHFKKKEFSKVLLIQESALIWVMTLAFTLLAFICVKEGYLGSLPWVASMIAFPWTAYGVSQAFYYNKSKAENTEGGVVFQNALASMAEAQAVDYFGTIPEDEVDLDYGI